MRVHLFFFLFCFCFVMYRTEEFTILQAEQGGPANDTQFPMLRNSPYCTETVSYFILLMMIELIRF